MKKKINFFTKTFEITEDELFSLESIQRIGFVRYKEYNVDKLLLLYNL
jgi:hypothetical protein